MVDTRITPLSSITESLVVCQILLPSLQAEPFWKDQEVSTTPLAEVSPRVEVEVQTETPHHVELGTQTTIPRLRKMEVQTETPHLVELGIQTTVSEPPHINARAKSIYRMLQDHCLCPV